MLFIFLLMMAGAYADSRRVAEQIETIAGKLKLSIAVAARNTEFIL